MKILEVHSRGCELGKRFSAFNAKITLDGKTDSIENHYQRAKCFNGKHGYNWKEAKGKTPDGVFIKGKVRDVELLTPFYYTLWMMYYIDNKDLLTKALDYDDYLDIFAGKSINTQDRTLRLWKENKEEYLNIVTPILKLFGR